MTLRNRLIIGMTVVAVVLVATAFAITRSTESYLIGQVDDQLRAAALGNRAGRLAPRGPRAPLTRRDESDLSSLYVGIVDSSGELQVLRVPNLRSDTIALPSLSARRLAASDVAGPRLLTAGSAGSSLRYRILITDPGPRGTRVVIGLPLADVDSTLDRLVRVEVVTTGLILGLLALVTFWVLRLGVRPIKAMTTTASAIATGDLSHRVPDVKPRTEAGQLGEALNVMLGRIQEAFAQREATESRLRRFAADASHELRTPVATIRGYAELYRRGALNDRDELADAMRRTEQEATRMGVLIEDLLSLARLDQGRPLELTHVDLVAIASDALADAHAVQPDRPLSSDLPEHAVVLADEGRLRQAVANLVSNALNHTPPSTPVEIRITLTGEGTVMEFRDAGPGMTPKVAGQAFERFYRGDPARTRNQGGTGLGLSITESVVRAHGGSVELHTAPGQGTTVRVTLPS